jgi:hypothetical protein
MTRTKRSTVTFSRAFTLETAKRSFPAGAYELVTDEELIEGLSFAAYRRVASWIITPEQNSSSATEMIVIDPVEFAAAHARDAAYRI